jgi:phenylpropionate dioxygenase-like ring-hydroxylating dioxygenase large terminal subunit
MTNTLSFNNINDVPLGWVWVCTAKSVGRKKIRAINMMGREIIVFRGEDGKVGALDAFCPHMGAHLVDGSVEGNSVRCFFHNWKFNDKGKCIDIPCLQSLPSKKIEIQSFTVKEQYGLIWLYTGDTDLADIPCVPELKDQKLDFSLGNQWQKNCHPNVVMINAIDEHHFQTVHQLPGHILKMEPKIIDTYNIHFENQGKPSAAHWFGRLMQRFYKGPITYHMSYWYGLVGTVTLGPDFLHLYLMFALRPQPDGTTLGKTIAFTKHRKGVWGRIFNSVILQITKLAGFYFAIGDTKVFQKIQFDLKNPIKNDKAVLAFIKHLEKQPKANWHTPKEREVYGS